MEWRKEPQRPPQQLYFRLDGTPPLIRQVFLSKGELLRRRTESLTAAHDAM